MDYQREQQELNRFFNYYYTLANNRVSWAQSWIADAYFWGWGVQQDYNKFVEWDTKAARNGSDLSAKRMLLYYHSIHSYEASATLTIKSYELLKSSMVRSFDDYLKLYGNKNALEMIDAYANATDYDEEYKNNQIEYRKESAILLRTLCYIYGFGVEPNYQQAMVEILKKEAPKEDEKYWDIDCNLVHYYYCLREIGIDGNEIFENNIYNKSSYRYGFFQEKEENVYKVRHFIRRAMLGDLFATQEIGLELMEKKDKVDNESRRLFYHDDNRAMGFLAMVAGAIPNSYASYEAVELSSDPDKKTYNYDYAKQLCFKIESNLDFAKKDEKYQGVADIWIMRIALIKAFINLAKSTINDNEKREFGNNALNQYQKNKQDDEEFKREDLLGMIYFEAFHELQHSQVNGHIF